MAAKCCLRDFELCIQRPHLAETVVFEDNANKGDANITFLI